MAKMKITEDIVIFTDGASSGNPGPGGYGAVIVSRKDEWVEEIGEGKKQTTNNEMELAATLSAFSHIEHRRGTVRIFSDSTYVINGITKWIRSWKVNNWQTRAKEDVSHKALWQKLSALVDARTDNISWTHLHGHVGIVGNERADTIATAFATGKAPELFDGALGDYDKDILNIEIDRIKMEEKKQKSKHQSAKTYVYLSLVDGKLERHDTWAECEARVRGQSAKYRKATSPEHEKEILSEWGIT